MVRFPSWWRGAVVPHAGALYVPGSSVAARRIPKPGIEQFTNTATVDIGNYGNAQAVANASGAALASCGPEGVGNVWYPTSFEVSTSTGIATGGFDGSFVTVYLGPVPVGQVAPPLSASTVLLPTQGGGSAVGGISSVVTPGWAITAVWSGVTQGATCMLRVLGSQDVLI